MEIASIILIDCYFNILPARIKLGFDMEDTETKKYRVQHLESESELVGSAEFLMGAIKCSSENINRLLSKDSITIKGYALSGAVFHLENKDGNSISGDITSLARQIPTSRVNVISVISGDVTSKNDWHSKESAINDNIRNFSIYDNSNNKYLTGTMSELAKIIKANKNLLKKLIYEDVKFFKTYSVKCEEYKLFHINGDESVGKVSELAESIGCSIKTIIKLASDEDVVFQGWSKSKDSAKSKRKLTSSKKVKKPEGKTHKIIDLLTGIEMNGMIGALCEQTGISKHSLSCLVNKKSVIVKNYSLKDRIFTLLGYQGNTVVGTVSELMLSTELPLLSITRIVQNSDICIKGWSLNKEALVKFISNNKWYRKYDLCSSRGEVVSGFVDELVKSTGLKKTAVVSLLTNHQEYGVFYKGWLPNKIVLQDETLTKDTYKTELLLGQFTLIDANDPSLQVVGDISEISKITGIPKNNIKSLVSGLCKSISENQFFYKGKQNKLRSWVYDRNKISIKSETIYSVSHNGINHSGTVASISKLSGLTEVQVSNMIKGLVSDLKNWKLNIERLGHHDK